MKNNENGPWAGKRYDLKGLNGRDQYILIDEEGIMVSFPDNKRENWNYQATATLATRLISICMRAKVGMDIIKKQLIDSSMQKSDTPDLLLEAINKFEEDRKK